MAIIPTGTRFDAIRVNPANLNKRSSLINTQDPTYTISDFASTIGTATQGPAGPAGQTGATGATGQTGPMGPVGPAGLNWQGAWVSGADYLEDDAVGYDGASWFCIADIPDGTVAPNLDTTHWALLASQGAVGPQGPAGSDGLPGASGTNGIQGPIGLDWQGTWVTGTSYGLTDTVYYNGSSYYCTSVSPFVSTVTPNLDTTHWSLLAQKGADGAAGAGLIGQSYILVAGDGASSGANGLDLKNKYNIAAGMMPYGSPLSATNRITVLVAPGTYALGTTMFMMNDYVDVVSLTGKQDVIITTSSNAAIVASANSQHISGLKLLGNKKFQIGINQADLIVENCTAGSQSFGYGSTNPRGTFINCTAGTRSFGYYNGTTTVLLTCIGCTAGSESFGAGTDLTVQGTYTNCTAGASSFGYGTNVVTAANFTNCTAGNESFGSGIGCTAGGEFRECKAGIDSFGSGNTASKFTGRAYNCQADDNSFGGDNLMIQGLLINCQLTTGTFKTVDPSGVIRFGLDGTYTIINSI